METAEKKIITVETTVKAPVEKVWRYWTEPRHIMKWNNATPDWHTPRAENDVRKNGKFNVRMEAKDGSFGFDFGGTYDEVIPDKMIKYTMGDDRKVAVTFTGKDSNTTQVTETFETETQNTPEMQQQGWQAILDNFRKYVESSHLHFEVTINAPVNKVYETMLNDNTYRQWTSEFNETSHYKGSWDKGEKIYFIGTDENGAQGGMVSRISENTPNRFVSIEHLGILKGEEEITSGSEVDSWNGAFENYTFNSEDGRTRLMVDMDTNEAFKSYFEDTWPKALNKLKLICEK
jgi:uncharacterized protein YndB with AHSA1/START domain